MTNNLHILTQNNFPSAVLACQNTDGIVLTSDAVYLLLQALPAELAERKIYVLEDALNARGINNNFAENIEFINYSKLVTLIIEHGSNTTW